MSFGELLETAMAGTERREVSAARPAFEALTPAGRLLKTASYEGMRRLAGRPLDPVAGVVAVEACPPETLRAIPAPAAARVLHILAQRPELVLEWLGLVAARNWRVSHDCLPELLDYASTRGQAYDLVLQVGGERLRWLANLHPDWQIFAAAGGDPEAQLGDGTPALRVRALARLRRQDAARARELLQGMWRAQRADARAALLDALADEFVLPEDEALFQQAVQDPRKELREKGLRLIRRIPNSRFSQRWIERARQVVAFSATPETGPGVEVREPAEVAPAWIDDGLDPRTPKGMGATAWILQQVLALTPPSIWPHGTLGALQRSEWSQPLLSGLAKAAAAYTDAEWCEELLLSDAASGPDVNSSALLGALTPERAEAICSRLLESRSTDTAALMVGLHHAWSDGFSRRVVAHLPGLLDRWQGATSSLLHVAALRLDPRVLPEAQSLVDDDSVLPWARPGLQRLLKTLAFRVAMRRELEPT